jgi:hypothetical protein
MHIYCFVHQRKKERKVSSCELSTKVKILITRSEGQTHFMLLHLSIKGGKIMATVLINRLLKNSHSLFNIDAWRS